MRRRSQQQTRSHTFGDAPVAPVEAAPSFDALAAFNEVAPAPAAPAETEPTTGSLPDWLTTDYEEEPAEPPVLSQRTPSAPATVNAEVADSVEAIAGRSPEDVRNVLSRYTGKADSQDLLNDLPYADDGDNA